MAHWRCKSCGVIIDNGQITRPEDQLKEWTDNPTPCPVCESTQGYDNPNYTKQQLDFWVPSGYDDA